ncbi:hypothetical protein HELRODRAFT_180676 [Helobdella robusta]|uniref:Uncharacterized protein n=1 Tax=Helobdella robusta TaxID=6412 RepID=T1FG56_HELRO|nr:hypothetical protein HELRODRAFT_180676 [Helobdella robusta]ESN93587.1 hypothetical protein HELRODRAFT_180676 [Helobdella robusta]
MNPSNFHYIIVCVFLCVAHTLPQQPAQNNMNTTPVDVVNNHNNNINNNINNNNTTAHIRKDTTNDMSFNDQRNILNNSDTTNNITNERNLPNDENHQQSENQHQSNNQHLLHLVYESSQCLYSLPRPIRCQISTTDKYMNAKVNQMVEKERITLIEYSFHFTNYTHNPFLFNATFYHKPHIWSRTSTTYGQTLLSLAFNYGILSLMTLTFGTTKTQVELNDSPYGCFGQLPEMDKMSLIRELTMVDFLNVAPNKDHENKTKNLEVVQNGARICHEIVENDNGYARFTDCCCYADVYSGQKVCINSSQNSWLTFLYTLLSIVRYCIFFFGPMLFLSAMTGLARDEFPYTVKLNDKLNKTVMLCRSDQDVPEKLKYKYVLDFRNKRGFPKFKDSITLANKEIDDFWKNKENSSLKSSQNLKPEAPKLTISPVKSESKEKLDGEESDADKKEEAFELPKSLFNCPVHIQIKEYDISINYKRLVTENDVSIGFWKTISNMIFMCRLRNVGPFQDCCRENMFKHALCLRNRPISWLTFWKIIGSILLVVLLPTPYYLRLWVLYKFEINEILSRKYLLSTLGLTERFENSLLHYFLPDHILFAFIYLVYILLAVCFVAMPEDSEDGKIKQVVISSFTDLKNLSWVDVLHMLVSNIIWPFKRFGVMGFLVSIVYLPFVIPFSLIVFCMYCLPTLFLTARMIFYSKKVFREKRVKKSRRAYRVNRKTDNNLRNFYMERWFQKCTNDDSDVTDDLNNNIDSADNRNEYNSKINLMKQTSKMSDILDIDEVDHLNPSKLKKSRTRSASLASTVITFDKDKRACRVLGQLLVSVACIVVLYAILIIITECLGSLVDMLVFTMMGIIVNAGSLLKYIALIIMIVVYSYDSFNNVEKKYLKLNKALFTEVKSRIKDLDKVTSLPSYLQENRGFKAQELNEQADHEMPDDVSERLPRHWFINDLVLFVDNEDMPRIPKKLFENVCEIKVAGVPGPVYRGLLLALKQFIKIVTFIVFVFIVVLTFGNVYEVSNTNQMLAALAGGSLPFILRTFMEPEKPEIEMGTVSFKSKLDEVIKNFAQVWPMYDFDFQLYKPEEDSDSDSEDGSKKKSKKERKDSLSKKHSETLPARKISNPHLDVMESDRSRSIDNMFFDYMCPPSSSATTTTTTVQQPQSGNHRTVAPTKSNQSAKVCFKVPEKEDEETVDIVILLPEEFDLFFDDPLVSSKF